MLVATHKDARPEEGRWGGRLAGPDLKLQHLLPCRRFSFPPHALDLPKLRLKGSILSRGGAGEEGNKKGHTVRGAADLQLFDSFLKRCFSLLPPIDSFPELRLKAMRAHRAREESDHPIRSSGFYLQTLDRLRKLCLTAYPFNVGIARLGLRSRPIIVFNRAR